MQEINSGSFQETVSDYLIRHRSILDVLSKLQESSARVQRAVAKSVTSCGCISINASKQRYPEKVTTLAELKEFMQTHLAGSLCEDCRDVVEKELGSLLFYATALCQLLDMDLDEVIAREHKNVSTLGYFHLS